jgi:hypothetical protein
MGKLHSQGRLSGVVVLWMPQESIFEVDLPLCDGTKSVIFFYGMKIDPQ